MMVSSNRGSSDSLLASQMVTLGWFQLSRSQSEYWRINLAAILIVVLAIIGFPITLLLTWALQLTPDGLIVDLPHGGNDGRWRHAYIVGFAALLISIPFLGYYLVYPGDTPPSDNGAVPGRPLLQYASAPENSIAVLPFSNLSESSEDEYLADGLAEEILNATETLAARWGLGGRVFGESGE